MHAHTHTHPRAPVTVLLGCYDPTTKDPAPGPLKDPEPYPL